MFTCFAFVLCSVDEVPAEPDEISEWALVPGPQLLIVSLRYLGCYCLFSFL